MGINAELVSLTAQLRKTRQLAGDTVVEIGAQTVCATPERIAAILDEHGFNGGAAPIAAAAALYARLGFKEYVAIDANGENGALMLDLNRPLAEAGFDRQFDLVTNLGTAEHCFDQFAVFKNLHDLCRTGGVMIHALPVQGLVNHGFYNYHPRFIADLATANGYELIDLGFTVDFTRTLHKYDLATFKAYDSRDLMIYAVLRKRSGAPFQLPFDGMFARESKLAGYVPAGQGPLDTAFGPYLKTGRWENTKGLDPGDEATTPVFDLRRVPAKRLIRELIRRIGFRSAAA